MKFTITVDMHWRWVPHFLGMLKRMEFLGNIGASRDIIFYSDGDGDFRPKFSWDGQDLPPPADPARNPDPEGGVNDRPAHYDAG